MRLLGILSGKIGRMARLYVRKRLKVKDIEQKHFLKLEF